METVFPFGLPSATALYLLIYIATFALHQLCMHYVVAGSLVWLGAQLVPKTAEAASIDKLASMFLEWLPLALSAAITAGVAPLLFVQIVYPFHFYTANVLLGWRWMIVVPVLIAAFYALYIAKSNWVRKCPQIPRVLLAVALVVSFVFVGFCWTANHTIANSPQSWPLIYTTGSTGISPWLTTLRMLSWIAVSFASLAVVGVWQLRWSQLDKLPEYPSQLRFLAEIAIAGLVTSAICGSVYLLVLPNTLQVYVFGRFAWPYLFATVLAAIVQLAVWMMCLAGGKLNDGQLRLVSLGYIVALLSASVVRESVRLGAIPIQSLYEQHGKSAAVGGLMLFVCATVANGLAIVYCIWLVRSSIQAREKNSKAG